MEYNEALRLLETDNPLCNKGDLRVAFDSAIKDVVEYPLNQRKYAEAIPEAFKQLRGWFETGNEYAVKLNFEDIAKFTMSHRPACVYAVLMAKHVESLRAAK